MSTSNNQNKRVFKNLKGDSIMLKILGENYFIDLDEIQEYINIPNKKKGEDGTIEEENSISVVKYELVKMLLDTILTENELVDETMGFKASGLSIPFKIALNTLLNKNIITKY